MSQEESEAIEQTALRDTAQKWWFVELWKESREVFKELVKHTLFGIHRGQPLNSVVTLLF